MSRASAYIRLPNGAVRYSLYEGTCDHIWRQTYSTLDEAWAEYSRGDVEPCRCPDLVRVDYWQAYSAGIATVMDYCPRCAILRPISYDFFDHCDAIGVELDGSDQPDGWVPQHSIPEWWLPAWVKA